jgi:hypothetical protein
VQWVKPTDVNDDGIPEIPVNTHTGMFDTVSQSFYVAGPGNEFNSSIASKRVYVTNMRRIGIAEFVLRHMDPDYFMIKDIATGDVLLQLGIDEYHADTVIYDYDFDGLDDVCLYYGTHVFVYGVATGNPPISPPQELDIQQVGQDYVINWSPVSTATAYRIEWSSALDGVGFTRIGYTTGTTFTHRNQAGQERGFYRVLSEDNGTGMVRVVGRSR